MSSTEDDKAVLCRIREIGLKESEAKTEPIVESIVPREGQVVAVDEDEGGEALPVVADGYPSVTPPSGGKRAAHRTRLCASKITQGFQKRSATDAARNSHTTSWKTTKDRETSRLTVLSKNSIRQGPIGPVMQDGHCERLVSKQLETIHPNPGPARRGKTERTPARKAERKERRKKKRLKKREKPSSATTTTRKRIVIRKLKGYH